jgi:hypothetical protein
MIRSVRRLLRSLLGDQLVNDESLHTTMTEIERILNGRPLVKLNSEHDEYAVLTPNHLLLLGPNECTNTDATACESRLNRHWRQAQSLADAFWKRWKKQYLASLQLRQKWLTRRPNLQIGDLVLLTDGNKPRGQWSRGIVEKLNVGSDGAVRDLIVRTNAGTFRRDVRQLCLLERVDCLAEDHDS